jgi:hypothetical protein
LQEVQVVLAESDEKVAHFQSKKQFTFLLCVCAKSDKVNVVTLAISFILPLKASLFEFLELICMQDQKVAFRVHLSALPAPIIVEEIVISVGLVSKIATAEILVSCPIKEPRHFLGHRCRALPLPRCFE